ncbi:MAG: hypothetical protein ABT14_09945 [Pelagibacterium sp. SCN 63-17]|nr:MAG: hypothetical protein ABT14_09945 [Pelagibacterium sp. SCN 63-17]
MFEAQGVPDLVQDDVSIKPALIIEIETLVRVVAGTVDIELAVAQEKLRARHAAIASNTGRKVVDADIDVAHAGWDF